MLNGSVNYIEEPHQFYLKINQTANKLTDIIAIEN